MGRRRAKNQVRRTFIPDEYLRLLGTRIQLALQEEHIRYDESRKRRTRYSIKRVCVATGIPMNTMNAFIAGKRQPSILDFREICGFAGVTFEDLMSVIPSRKELDELYDEAKRKALEDARMARDEPDDDEDWGDD